jgi:predicted transposase/invertase (TIGR01784 family)
MKKILSPMSDFVFKLIFGDRRNVDILTNFLKSVLTLPEDEYDYLTIVDPFLKPEAENEKMSILDVKVHTTTGKVIDVEIQVESVPGLPERIVSYGAGMLRGQIRKGGKYQDTRQVICILITNYVLVPEEEDYYNEISLRYAKSGREFTNILKFITLELPKLPKQDDAREVWSWLKFMKSQREEDFMAIAEQNPQLRRPVAVLMKLSGDERARMSSEAQERFRMDNEARMDGAYRSGKEEGKEEGYEQGVKERDEKIARKMKYDGFSPGQISKYTGLAPEEIQNL